MRRERGSRTELHALGAVLVVIEGERPCLTTLTFSPGWLCQPKELPGAASILWVMISIAPWVLSRTLAPLSYLVFTLSSSTSPPRAFSATIDPMTGVALALPATRRASIARPMARLVIAVLGVFRCDPLMSKLPPL